MAIAYLVLSFNKAGLPFLSFSFVPRPQEILAEVLTQLQQS